jgi:hypothetical protein
VVGVGNHFPPKRLPCFGWADVALHWWDCLFRWDHFSAVEQTSSESRDLAHLCSHGEPLSLFRRAVLRLANMALIYNRIRAEVPTSPSLQRHFS